LIDVLSFTTTLTVALDGGTTVLLYPWNDSNAANFARQHDAVLAVDRATAEAGQISLSPATLRTARPPERLVLPSPNGSTIARHLSERAHTVLGASLRNASAVAQWISEHHDPAASSVAVIAAGERCPETLSDLASKISGEPAHSSLLYEPGAGPRTHRRHRPPRPPGRRLPPKQLWRFPIARVAAS